MVTPMYLEPYTLFSNRYDTNRDVQALKMTRGLKFRIWEEEELYYIYVAKAKALISCAITAQLIFAFVFAYASHDGTQLV